MSSLEDFSEITRPNEPLAQHTWLKVGGPAQYFIEPRSRDELVNVVQRCNESEIGARAVDRILTHSLLPQMSAEVLSRMAAGEAFKRIAVDIGSDGEFAFTVS